MWVIHWGLFLRLPWRTWVFSCEGQVLLLGLEGFWQHQVLRGLVARIAAAMKLKDAYSLEEKL